MQTKHAEFLGGVRAQIPILLGVSPFGLIYGINAANAGMPVAVAISMSLFVFAGSSQFLAAQLVATGTPPIVIVLTTFVVNLRHMLYSASLAPYLRHLSQLWKYLLAFLLTDEAYAVAITHYEGETEPPVSETHRHWFTLGAGLTLWVAWQISTAIGVLVGAQFPSSWALDFTLALTFIALVIPTLRDRPAVIAALSAAIIALVTYRMPYKLGLIAAVLGGIIAGLVAESHAAALPEREP